MIRIPSSSYATLGYSTFKFRSLYNWKFSNIGTDTSRRGIESLIADFVLAVL